MEIDNTSLIIVITPMIFVIVGIINYLFFFYYLKKNNRLLLNELRNKKSSVNVPTVINLDFQKWGRYVLNFKEENKRILFHKILYVTSTILFIISFLFSFFNFR